MTKTKKLLLFLIVNILVVLCDSSGKKNEKLHELLFKDKVTNKDSYGEANSTKKTEILLNTKSPQTQKLEGAQNIICQEGCKYCNDSTSCIKCDEEYYIDSHNCFKCETGCQECLSSTHCYGCNSLYFFTSSYTCNKTEPDKPYFTYTYINDKIVAQTNDTCQEGQRPGLGYHSYARENNIVHRFSSYSRCINCLSNSYNDSEGRCHNCPYSCSACDNFQNCTSCDESQYYYYKKTRLENGECFSKLMSEGCANYNCDNCLTGYEFTSDRKCVNKTMLETKFILYGFEGLTLYGKTFGFYIHGKIMQGFLYEAQFIFDYNIKKYNEQNVIKGTGTCVLIEFPNGEGTLLIESSDRYSEDFMFIIQCEGKTTLDVNPYDEVNITNIKLAKLNEMEPTNTHIESTHLLNKPLNGPGADRITDIYNILRWFRFIVSNYSCNSLNDESQKISVNYTGSINHDVKINNLSFTVPVTELYSDEIIGNADCYLNKEENEKEANMECIIKNLTCGTFTLSKDEVQCNDYSYGHTYLTAYIENEDKKENSEEEEKEFSQNKTSSSGGISGGAIAGIVVGSVTGAAVVGGIAVVAATTIGATASSASAAAAGGATAAAGTAPAISSSPSIASLSPGALGAA